MKDSQPLVEETKDRPVVGAVEETQEVEPVVEEVKEDDIPSQVEETQENNALDVQAENEDETSEDVDDRSDFNCHPCHGDGLVGEKRCTECQGTGKV